MTLPLGALRDCRLDPVDSQIESCTARITQKAIWRTPVSVLALHGVGAGKIQPRNGGISGLDGVALQAPIEQIVRRQLARHVVRCAARRTADGADMKNITPSHALATVDAPPSVAIPVPEKRISKRVRTAIDAMVAGDVSLRRPQMRSAYCVRMTPISS
jgi:hypothetical protein